MFLEKVIFSFPVEIMFCGLSTLYKIDAKLFFVL